MRESVRAWLSGSPPPSPSVKSIIGTISSEKKSPLAGYGSMEDSDIAHLEGLGKRLVRGSPQKFLALYKKF